MIDDIPEGEKWLGAPAQPDRQAKRMMIAFQQLPDLIRRIKNVKKQLSDKRPSTSPAGLWSGEWFGRNPPEIR